jgi:class 3 adenylate cyclase/tetratricopeptide (TPR) repeat protein
VDGRAADDRATGGSRDHRRVVTALFADMRGSTARAESYDVEDVRELLRWFTQAAISAIEAFGGTVNDIAGDGVLGLFGAPTAREDDPERAVRAGLALQGEMTVIARRASTELGFPDVAVRVGIESGRVVAGLVGGGGRIEYGVTGDAVNVAARLQSMAPAGGVLVGPSTFREVGRGIVWGETLQLDLKGRSAAVEARLALSTIEDESAAAPPGLGRRRELATVVDAVAQLRAGHGSVVVVSGAPGIGKTWLISRAAAAAADEGALGWHIRCAPWDQDNPFAAVTELLATAGVATSAGDGDPGAQRRRVLLAVRDAATRRLRDRQLCVVAEDLHCADPSTLDVIMVLAELARTGPLLLLASTRDVTSAPALLAGARPRHVRLDRLPEEEARLLLEELVRPVALPADLARRVLQAAEGNPLYLHEFVRSWSDAGLLETGTDEQARTAAALAGIPPSLERLVLSRLDLLGDEARDVLSGVSVLQGDFDTDLAREVAGEVAGTESRLRERLAELVARGHLVDHGSHYAFRYDLVQEVVEASLVRSRRRELNRRAALAVERVDGDRPAGVLALYWQRAQEPAKAFGYHVLAARLAGEVSALVEALAHVDAACRLGDQLGLAEPEAVELLVQRAALRSRTGDAHGARSDAETAVAEAQRLGREDLLQHALEELSLALEGAVDYDASVQAQQQALRIAEVRDDMAGQVKGHARLAIHAANRLTFTQARTHAQMASRLAEHAGDEDMVATALDAAKQVAIQLGEADQVESLAVRLSGLNHRTGNVWREQFVQLERGLVVAEQARWELAESLLTSGLALNREVGDVGNEPLFLTELSWLARARGRYADAIAQAERASAGARSRGHTEWLAYAQLRLAQTCLETGDWSRAEQAARSASDGARTVGARVHEVPAHAALARALHEQGRAEDARHALAHCQSLLAEVTVPAGSSFLYGWDAYATVGLLTGLSGDVDRGMAMVDAVLAAAERARYHVAACMLLLVQARLLLSAGDAGRARRCAVEASGLAATYGMPGLGWRAEAALAGLADDPARQATHADAVRSRTDELLLQLDSPYSVSFETLRDSAIGDLRWP